MPAFDKSRPWEVRIAERLNTAIGALKRLGGPISTSVGKTAGSNVRDMPKHWSTSKRSSEATLDDVARGAINNLNKLVTEKHHIASFDGASTAKVGGLVRELLGLCAAFKLAHKLSGDRASALNSAIDRFRAAYR